MSGKVIILGGHGGGVIAADVVLALGRSGEPIELAGFLNDEMPRGAVLGGAPVLGPFEAWGAHAGQARFIAPLHKAKETRRRMQRVRSLAIPEDRWIRVIDPRANVGFDVSIGHGSVVSGLASIQPEAKIGNHVAIRSGAAVGHDVTIGDWGFVAINASVCGYARLGEGAYIGAGAAVREGVSIGRFAVVGMGAVVVDDVADGAIVGGSPARVLGRLDTADRLIEECPMALARRS